MKHFILFILILIPIFSCDLESQSYNGVYCANVHYYNPNTGTDSEYVLTLEVENNQLLKVNFPNGWMDEDECRKEKDAKGWQIIQVVIVISIWNSLNI